MASAVLPLDRLSKSFLSFAFIFFSLSAMEAWSSLMPPKNGACFLFFGSILPAEAFAVLRIPATAFFDSASSCLPLTCLPAAGFAAGFPAAGFAAAGLAAAGFAAAGCAAAVAALATPVESDP